MQRAQKTITVMGLAKTGVAVAQFLASQGTHVIATDMRQSSQMPEAMNALRAENITLVCGEHRLADFQKVDGVVTSPGVPREHPMLMAAVHAGVPVMSEIELAAGFITSPITAITGTNGKTTTTTITGEIFRHNGFKTFVGGNIGDPLINLIAQKRTVERTVVEVSSFQLEWIHTFKPRVAALLNLSEDHLDRYHSYDDYIDAKIRLFENQTSEDFAVVNRDDNLVWERTAHIQSQRFPFSRTKELNQGIFLAGSNIIYRQADTECLFSLKDCPLTGVHNIENIMAAVAATMLQGCRVDATQTMINQLEPLHHRMEFVAERAGVRYYEDSKATNVGSVVKALESFDSIVLIAGGKDKGGSYQPMQAMIAERVPHLVLIGEAADRMAQEFTGATTIHRATSLDQAVQIAASVACAGDVVLLSPACSSFDMFKDYEERAQRYIQAVKELAP